MTRKEYELTDEQYERIMEASKPVPYLVMAGTPPSSPRENAERVWREIGKELGFQWETAEPSRKGTHFFTAIPVD